MVEAMKRRGRTKPEQLEEDLAAAEKQRDYTHEMLQQAKAAREESLELASLGDAKALEVVRRNDVTIAQLTSSLAMYEEAIRTKHMPAIEAKRAYDAAQDRKAKIERLNGLLADRLAVIEALEAALVKAGAALNKQYDLTRQIERQREDLVGRPTSDALGHRYMPPATLETPRVVERVTRFWQHVEGALWIDRDAFSNLHDQKVPSLVEAERAAQVPYAVKE
ncbi:hypothetical protein [Dongia sp.]|uniref:hypothetical protein n=1 Tax=Dongia sp. TaxID=1977262 RepID=UPI00375135C7